MTALQKFTLNAQLRVETGRSASRRLRGAGRLPGILYGTGGETIKLSLDANEISRQLENEAFYSHVLTLKVGEREEQAVLKELQRHPCEPRLLHIDFLRIDKDKAITMRVPLHFTNEEQCVGVREKGGMISHVMTELEVSCLPQHLPEYISVDVSELDLGASIHLGEVKLPAGVELYALLHGGDPSQPVVSVHAPKVAAAEAEVEEQEDDEASEETTDPA